ncbi:MAG TPA: type II toxin-antitoxin system death-on-curing family toxin [Anaerolineales bacterium]|nr:type II toxin-antitoxin system death-on-curing family toxin [Anaerolineales bacterium]
MRYLTIAEVLETYQRVMQQTGGLVGIRDLGALESAIAQPYMTFDGNELYPSLAEKAAALGFSLIQNHPFADGNKRTGHAAMESFLALNGFEISATIEEQVDIILSLASGKLNRQEFTDWLSTHIQEFS